MSQIENSIQKYESVFHHSMNYGMTTRIKLLFYKDKLDEIKQSIEKTLTFIDGGKYEDEDYESYNFGDDAENIKIYAVSVLPFMLADELENPTIGTKKAYKEALQFLNYIKHNKGMANHHIYSTTIDKYTEGTPPITFDDFRGFDMEKLNKEIAIYEHLASMKVNPRRCWWSGIVQVRCLAYAVYIAWKPKQDKIINFLTDFFELFNPVDDDIVRAKIYQKAKEDDFIRLNPTFLLNHIL